MARRFWADEPIEELIAELSDGMDQTILELYADHLGERDDVALFAVGGYGRRELHPGSDIDLLLVANRPAKLKPQIEGFLRAVFDLNLEIGYAVRDLKSCRNECKQDITVMTAMLERRFLGGDERMVAKLDKVMDHPRLWPTEQFFRAKYDEQIHRHRDYDNIEYNLEPNVKTSPGGLRDIHTALWICKRHFNTTDPGALIDLGVLTAQEAMWLVEGRRFIWWVRFGLHVLAERKEDQLQFAHQRELAQRLGFVDTNGQRGVERFMHVYYRHVLALTEVNDILLQHFQENVLRKKNSAPISINERFQIVNGYMEITDPELFRRTPSALMELFVVMARRKDISGVRVNTIRAVRDSLDLIDEDFRNEPAHAQLFLDLLKAPYTIVSQLTRMRRYGVLARYLPEFGRVIGQMQHDLFHIYTVDAHTMAVIGNMRRFRYRASREEFPVAYHCVHAIPKVELLYIAGLYHDIGKGRGGDHSVLGAEDALQFCQRHKLNAADTELVCWLVKKHLYMSSVAQRQDIYDPDVVQKFAQEMKSEMRLDYLYALTVADINATNPTLWNSWRATLLRQLYTETRRALRHGIETLADKVTSVEACRESAQERLLSNSSTFNESQIQALWSSLGEDFFLRHSAPQVARLTSDILTHRDGKEGERPFVAVHDTFGDLPGEGASKVYIYVADQPQLFAKTVHTLASFDLSVVDAIVHTDVSGMCFDTYTVLTDEGLALPADSKLRSAIAGKLSKVIADPNPALKPAQRRLPRRLRELAHPTEVTISNNPQGPGSSLTIIANDRPGLLATIAGIFVDLELQLLSAKIATLGERVEDTFVVTDAAGNAIAAGEASYTLQETIRQHIDVAVHQSGSRAS